MTLCFTQIVWDFPLLNMQSDAVKSELSEHLQLKQEALGSILGGWSFSLPATNVAFFFDYFLHGSNILYTVDTHSKQLM